MIKNILIISAVCFVMSNTVHSQNYQINLKLKESPGLKTSYPNYKKSDLPTYLFVLGIAAIISPMAVFEDKKVFFALTKEISFGKFPYGRVSIEYSYVFRSYNTSHLRFSYNYDFVLFAADFLGAIASPGAGYFTDAKNSGWFLQGSAGVLFAKSDQLAIHPYIKYRHTFIKDKLKSDIDDVSLGMAFIFYF
jgi:hypothetical protein